MFLKYGHINERHEKTICHRFLIYTKVISLLKTSFPDIYESYIIFTERFILFISFLYTFCIFKTAGQLVLNVFL